VELEDFKDIYTVSSDGVTVKAWPLKTHLRMLQCFLLWFKWHNRSFYCTTSEDDVLLLQKSAFDEYIRSEEYAEDNAAASILAAASLRAPPSTGSGSGNVGTSGTTATGGNVVPGTMTAQEFRHGVKRDIAHYTNVKDDEHFSTWHWKFVATACMHHTHLVLDPKYVTQDDVAKAAFKEMQIFMYAVMAEHFKTDKGKSLVSQYEKDHDAQSIYRDLKKHALGSTSAWLSGDALLKNITSAWYP
jgi:hypothetical protein